MKYTVADMPEFIRNMPGFVATAQSTASLFTHRREKFRPFAACMYEALTLNANASTAYMIQYFASGEYSSEQFRLWLDEPSAVYRFEGYRTNDASYCSGMSASMIARYELRPVYNTDLVLVRGLNYALDAGVPREQIDALIALHLT